MAAGVFAARFLDVQMRRGDTPLDDRELAERNWTFAHSHGVSLGRLTGAQLADLVQQVWQLAGVASIAERKRRSRFMYGSASLWRTIRLRIVCIAVV